MKRTIASLAVFACMFVVGLVPNAQARHECSNASLQGSYGYMGNGTVFGRGLLGFAGKITFDDKGNASVVETLLIEDIDEVQHVTDTATYTVNRDCTGSVVFSQFSPIDIVVVDSGKELFAVAARRGRVITWIIKKQFPRDHDDEEE